MRLIIFALLALLMQAGDVIAQQSEAATEAEWLYDFETARSEARTAHLPILISFSGSDWCIPCMRLERDLFSTESFKTFTSGHFILLKLDFPARKKNQLSADQLRHNEALAERYNKRGTFPLVLVTDAEGNVLGEMAHPLASSEAYIASLEAFVE